MGTFRSSIVTKISAVVVIVIILLVGVFSIKEVFDFTSIVKDNEQRLHEIVVDGIQYDIQSEGKSLKNAMIPVLTYTVIEIPFLITGSFLLESFFGIPGLGSITIDAIHNSDFPVIKAMTTIETLLFIGGNLLTDVLYSMVDPRVRLR